MARTSTRVRVRKAPSPRHPRWLGPAIGALLLLVGWVAYSVWELPSSGELARLKTGPVRETALMRARRTSAKRPLRIVQRQVDLASVSTDAVAAVVASEDARFFAHTGLDLKQIRSALQEGAEGRKVRGASTITQQVAKNLYLSEDRSLLRKVKEAVIAWRMEGVLSKRRILTIYLNVAEWGEGVFGIDAAAQVWRSKRAADLSLAEGAALAAMLPSPKRISPANPELLYKRALHVLNRVEDEHLATPVQVAAARIELALWLHPAGAAPPDAPSAAAPEAKAEVLSEEAAASAATVSTEPAAASPAPAEPAPAGAPPAQDGSEARPPLP